jgi:hypothetical protein
MNLHILDTVWSAMLKNELYTPADLANTLEQTTDAVALVLEFLSRYGFVHRVTKHELIFRKTANAPCPSEMLRILGLQIGDLRADPRQRPSVSKTPRRLISP